MTNERESADVENVAQLLNYYKQRSDAGEKAPRFLLLLEQVEGEWSCKMSHLGVLALVEEGIRTKIHVGSGQDFRVHDDDGDYTFLGDAIYRNTGKSIDEKADLYAFAVFDCGGDGS